MTAESEAEKRAQQTLERRNDFSRMAALLDGDVDLDENGEPMMSFMADERLTDAQKKLLTEIRRRFAPEEVVADLCILYETTGY